MAKLIKSTVKNIGAIDSAEFNFSGKTAIIIGANGTGKTTVIERLKLFCQGQNGAVLLKDNAQDGYMEYELSTGEKIALTVKNGENNKAVLITKDGKEQAITNKIANRLFPSQLDLNQFILRSPAKQREMLSKSLGVDTTQLDSELKELKKEREEVGREVKRLTGSIATMGEYDPEMPKTEVSAKSILDWISKANERNNVITKAANGLANIKEGVQKSKASISSNNTKILELKTQIANLEAENKAIETHIAETQQKIQAGETWMQQNQPVLQEDFDAKNLELTQLESKNANIRKNADIAKQGILLETQKAEYEQYTAAIEVNNGKRAELFKTANLPENIQITDEGIFVDGLPLVQNQHARSTVGIAELKLAHATLGECEWLTFDAASLDRANFQNIVQWAQSVGVQLLVEIPNREAEDKDYLHFEIVE